MRYPCLGEALCCHMLTPLIISRHQHSQQAQSEHQKGLGGLIAVEMVRKAVIDLLTVHIQTANM